MSSVVSPLSQGWEYSSSYRAHGLHDAVNLNNSEGSKPVDMNEGYKIVHVDKPGDPEWGSIGKGIGAYNTLQAGDDHHKHLCLVLHAPDQVIVGGIIGATYWDWFHIDLLWVEDELRGRGHGRRLLALAEQEARQRGALNAYLDTFSFQAPEFYKKSGYRVFGELQDFPHGCQRYFMTKQL